MSTQPLNQVKLWEFSMRSVISQCEIQLKYRNIQLVCDSHFSSRVRIDFHKQYQCTTTVEAMFVVMHTCEPGEIKKEIECEGAKHSGCFSSIGLSPKGAAWEYRNSDILLATEIGQIRGTHTHTNTHTICFSNKKEGKVTHVMWEI